MSFLFEDSERFELCQSLEQRATNLFYEVGSKLIKQCRYFTLHTDNSLDYRRDRTENNIHLFMEQYSGDFFHLMAYIRHMLEVKHRDAGMIYLTGYIKDDIQRHGGVHALRQDWYPMDSQKIAEEVRSQNQQLFGLDFL